MKTSNFMKLNVKELVDFFDNKKDDIRHDISSVIGVVGEDLGAALFKRYCEKTLKKKVTISTFQVLSGKMKGPRLDRWIYVEQSKNKFTTYQTEIKNWSAYAIGARSIGTDPKTIPAIGLLNWKERSKRLKHKDKNGESKVFFPMKKPIDFPNKATLEPLIIYWFVLSKDGKNLDPFFKVNMPIKGFKKLNVFSMSNYLRSIKEEEIILNMPSAEKRIKLLKKYFPLKK
jgi:hypothetical protein